VEYVKGAHLATLANPQQPEQLFAREEEERARERS